MAAMMNDDCTLIDIIMLMHDWNFILVNTPSMMNDDCTLIDIIMLMHDWNFILVNTPTTKKTTLAELLLLLSKP